MSRLDEQIDRDLGVIAERVTPSPDAWAEIQQRIADRQPEQDTEIIMLTENTLTKRRWPLVAAAAAVAALAIGAIAVVNRDDGTEQPADVPEPTPTVAPAPESITTFPTGLGPYAVVSDGTSVWITNISQGTNTLSKMNPDDGERVDFSTGDEFAGVGAAPRTVVFDGTNIWAANSDNTVSKVDPDDGTSVDFPTDSLAGTTPLGMVFDGTSIWITNLLEDTVSKMNPDDGTRVVYPTGAGPVGIAFDGTSIWIANSDDNTVSKMNPDDGTRTDYPTGTLPQYVAVDGTSIWITNSGDDTVSQLDPDDGTRVDYPTGAQPFAITSDGTSIWITNAADGTVSKMNPGDGTRTDIPTGSLPRGVAFDGTNIWVTNNGDNTVSRIDPNIVEGETVQGETVEVSAPEEASSVAAELPNEGFSLTPGRFATELVGPDVSFEVDEAVVGPWSLRVARPGTIQLQAGALDEESIVISRVGSLYDPDEARDPNMTGLGSFPPDATTLWNAGPGVVVLEDILTTVDGRDARHSVVALDPDDETGLEADVCPATPCLWAGSGSADLIDEYPEPLPFSGERQYAFWSIDMGEFEPLSVLAFTDRDDADVWLAEIIQPIVDSIVLGEPAPVIPGGTARVPEQQQFFATATAPRGEGTVLEDGTIERIGRSTVTGDLTGEMIGTGIELTPANGYDDIVFTGTIDGIGTGTLTMYQEWTASQNGDISFTTTITDASGDFTGITGRVVTALDEPDETGPVPIFTSRLTFLLAIPRT